MFLFWSGPSLYTKSTGTTLVQQSPLHLHGNFDLTLKACPNQKFETLWHGYYLEGWLLVTTYGRSSGQAMCHETRSLTADGSSFNICNNWNSSTCTIDDWRHVQVNKLRNSQKRASSSAPRLLGVKNISWSKGKSGQTRLTYNCAHLIRSTKESLTFEYDIWWYWVSRRRYWLVLGGTGSV